MFPKFLKFLFYFQIREQVELKESLITHNEAIDVESLQLVAGVDISFAKDDYVHACAAFIVVSFPDLKVRFSICCHLEILVIWIWHFLCNSVTLI